MIFRALRMLVTAGLVLLAGLVGWAGYDVYREWTRTRREQQERIEDLRAEVERRKHREAVLKAMVARLEKASRVARVQVLKQQKDLQTERIETRLLFQHLDDKGQVSHQKEMTLEGEVVYFDALVIQFDPELVALGDALRGKSIYLFRRAFGEHQNPSDGQKLTPPGRVPKVYQVGKEVDPYEAHLWQRFWQLAEDPAEARKERVRVAQIEAVATKLKYGKVYELEIQHAGGLLIRPVP